MFRHLLRTVACALLFAFVNHAEAKCGLSLAVGTMRITNIPTERADGHLTRKYIGVRTRVHSSSTVNEEGIECELGAGFSLALSGIQGLKASVDRTVYFKGYSLHGIALLPQTDLFDLNESASARAVRVSALYTLGSDWTVSPFVRLGIERVKAVHTAKIPFTYTDPDGEKVYALSYEKQYKKTAPYLGMGLTYKPFERIPVYARIEYQYMAPSPHRLDAILIGVGVQFAF